jgi:acetamidase/formamidase
MKHFNREHIRTHFQGAEWPEFLGRVEIGETFVIETERFNLANGPIKIDGVRAGEPIAVHIEGIEIQPPYEAPNGGPFFEGMGDPVALDFHGGEFVFPGGQRLKARPSIGNVAVLPEPSGSVLMRSRRDLGPPREGVRGWGWRGLVNDPRGKHCHQDCAALTAGAVIHLRAQVDGAGLCFADVHGYIGAGEMAFAGIETAASLTARVTRSEGWYVDWPLIETEDEIMVFSSDAEIHVPDREWDYVDVVRNAYWEMRKVVAARIGTGIAAANPIVASALDIRNCALYGLGNFIQKAGKLPDQRDQDIAVVGALPKAVLNAER